MKPALFFLSLCFFLLFFGVIASAEPDTVFLEPKIAELTESEVLDLTDGDYSTAYTADSLTLTLSADKPISAVYIIWNTEPSDYSIYENDINSGVGCTITDRIMHKLIKLQSPCDRIIFKCPDGGSICDIYLFADNNFPDFVQDWRYPCAQADILILSAHADDEFLMFGGTIPYYAKERGLQVQVAYMTNHWEEQPRPHELLDGLWTAGVKNYPVIGIIPDIPYQPIFTLSEAAQLYDFEEVKEWFTAQIRRFKPSVIVTHDINGEYGHAAHKLAAKTVVDAVEISADPQAFPDSAEMYGVWDVPKTYLHFWQENSIQMDWEIPLESFGGITAGEAAALCYDKHKSQHIWGYSVNYGENWDCRQFGLYRSLVGSDTNADFMDNITPVTFEEITEPPTETQTEPPAETKPQTEPSTQEIVPADSDYPETQPPNNAPADKNNTIGYIFLSALILIIILAIVLFITSLKSKNKNYSKRQ